MKQLLVLIIGAVLIGAFLNPINAQWVQTNGPYGGSVQAIAVTKTNIIIGTYPTGIYFSSDHGATWKKSGTPLISKYGVPYVICFKVDGTKVFAGTDKGIFVSSDAGETWSAISSPLDWSSVNAFVKLGNEIFAASWGLYKSTDDGHSWSVTGLDSTTVTSLAVLDSSVFAATSKGVLVSNDTGMSWSTINDGFTNLSASCLKIVGSDIYAASTKYQIWLSGYDFDILRSTDKGKTWVSVKNGVAGTPGGCGGFSALSACDTSLFVATLGWGVFRSDDHGEHWINVDSGLTNTVVQCLGIDGSSLLAGTQQGISASDDNGSTWRAICDGITATQVEALFTDSDYLFASTWGGGIFRSSDGGDNWVAENKGLGNLYALGLVKNNNVLFTGTAFGVYTSTNNGDSWSFSGLRNYYIQCIAACGPRTFAGALPGGIFMSSDYGVTWDSLRVTKSFISCFFVLDSLILAGGSGAYRSTDGGTSWALADSGFPDVGGNVYPLLYSIVAAPDPNATGHLSLFTGGDYLGVFRSTDYGKSWASVGLTDIQIRSFGAVGLKILVGMWYKSLVYLSTDNGNTWTLDNSGLNTRNPVTSFAANGTYVFAGTEGDGVWRLPMSDLVSVRSSTNDLPFSFSLEQNYPNPFNPTTKFSFVIGHRSLVSLKVYDVLGREVATIVNKELPAGDYKYQWNVRNLASGVYFYRLRAGNFVDTKKLILLK